MNKGFLLGLALGVTGTITTLTVIDILTWKDLTSGVKAKRDERRQAKEENPERPHFPAPKEEAVKGIHTGITSSDI